LKSKDKESPSLHSRSSSLTSNVRSSSHFSSLISVLHSRTFIFYTLIPAIILSIITILSTDLDLWKLSEIHHFYIELFAVILGSILAFYYIARAHTLNDNFSRFVGFGFLVAALIDLLHVVISFAYMDNIIFLKYFIPQTWFAGRIFLSSMLVIAIAKYPTFSGEEVKNSDSLSEAKMKARSGVIQSNEFDEGLGKEGEGEQNTDLESKNAITSYDASRSDRTFGVYLMILSVLAGSVALSSLFLILPFSVVDYLLLHRPYEIPCLVLFVIALILFYKNQLYKKTDIFYKGILAYLIIDIYAQIIMSYSAVSFDTPHNVAHILKDAGYFVNIIALALSSIQYNVQLRKSNEGLIEGNVKLMEREEIIRIQYNRLKESERIKDEFINTAAHELRTPIQPILGLADIVRSRIIALDDSSGRVVRDGNTATRRLEGVLLLLGVIIRNAKRLKQLTDNILDVTKIESHSFKLNKEQFDIVQLIEEVIVDQNIMISSSLKRESGLEILCRIDDDQIKDFAAVDTAAASVSNSMNSIKEYRSVYDNNSDKSNPPNSYLVEADRAKISQVLTNLLSNAVNSIRARDNTEQGKISISVIKNNEMIMSVKDNGRGIAPEVLANLFIKFVSGSDSGTGLGLYISKNIIEAHGGRIWANNNDMIDGIVAAESTGATFSFSVPLN
jgi:signal transduction histidine kinase